MFWIALQELLLSSRSPLVNNVTQHAADALVKDEIVAMDAPKVSIRMELLVWHVMKNVSIAKWGRRR